MRTAQFHQGSSDRTVHALTADGAEVVRYDRAGKWYVEYPSGRLMPARHISLNEAIDLVLEDGTVLAGRPGGGAFDARVRARLAAQREAPEGGTQGP